MPSKGGSRQSHGQADAAPAGPTATMLQAVVGSGRALAVAAAPPIGNLVAFDAGPVIDDDPPVDSPAWVALYASALAQYRHQPDRTHQHPDPAPRLRHHFPH